MIEDGETTPKLVAALAVAEADFNLSRLCEADREARDSARPYNGPGPAEIGDAEKALFRAREAYARLRGVG